MKSEVDRDDAIKTDENLSHPPETTEVPADKLDDPTGKVNREAGLPELVDKVNDSRINGLETERDVDHGEKEDPMDLDADNSTSRGKEIISGDIHVCTNNNNDNKHIEASEREPPQTVEEPPRTASPPRKRVTRSQNIVNGSSVTPKTANHPKPTPGHKTADGLNELKNPPKPEDPNGPITITVTHPSALEAKILEVEGRIQSSGKHNAWKAIRCKRDNQDMGSLWEMREEYYVHRLSK